MNAAQDLFGMPAERARNKVKPYMVDWVQDYIRHSPFLVMASSGEGGACDASPRGGRPGFVKVLDERHLLVPDVAGNKLFQSYENFEKNPNVGLIFFIPGIEATARVNGRVAALSAGDAAFERLQLDVFNEDERAKLLQALLVTVTESYSHCPRALRFSKLWDAATIMENKENPPIAGWVAGL